MTTTGKMGEEDMAQEPLSKTEVEAVASLAKLALQPEEAASMTEQLAKIFDLVNTLAEVDTTGVKPTYSPSDVQNVLRADVAVDAQQATALLANAPEREGDLIKVPAIIDEGADK